MTSDYIIDVSEESFELDVLNYSAQAPVIMDFWAPWCIPCRVQSPLLASMAMDAQGGFRLARVNVDEQAKLAERLRVKTLPSIKAFVDGRMVAEYTGILTERNLRGFVQRILPPETNLAIEKAKSLILLDDYSGALESLQDYMARHPRSPEGLLTSARALLALGKGEASLMILNNFPPSPEFNTAQDLKPLAKALDQLSRGELGSGMPLDRAFTRGLRLIERGNIFAALDGFLDILRTDKHFREDLVRDIYLALLIVLGNEHPQVRYYRTQLGNTLF